MIQFPTVLASVAMPSSTVPAPYKTPRAVPHEVIPKSEKIKITTLMEYIEMINDKIFVILKLKWALVKGPMLTIY